MSDVPQEIAFSHKTLFSQLSICIFVSSGEITQSLNQSLSSDRYSLTQINFTRNLVNFVDQHKEQLDCLIVINDTLSLPLLNELSERGIILPIIIIEKEESLDTTNNQQEAIDTNLGLINYLYHSAELRVPETKLDQITSYIDQALTKFLHLAPSCAISDQPEKLNQAKEKDSQNFLVLQQRRLAEKLKERLGYLGVYYKRNFQYFYRNLSKEKQQELLEEISSQYRQIILSYFSPDAQTNQDIDQLVNQAFFSDISVSQVLEIHMELMDEFAQQLKLEGRSEDILLDYRLALIDIIAHLCEMYRRSIPREDIPFELLCQID